MKNEVQILLMFFSITAQITINKRHHSIDIDNYE